MTDLEMTKLCAEAMGFNVLGEIKGSSRVEVGRKGNRVGFDPLNDDAQAMALVREIKLDVMWTGRDWRVAPHEYFLNDGFWVFNADLRRAIVECVAKMQSRAGIQTN